MPTAKIATKQPERSPDNTLRFMTCGSVDDGKSTLIGRLLIAADAIYDDQRTTLESDSRQYGTTGPDLDYALLCDGLQSEREQGITIDVAYRYFATSRRRYIVADTPGHEQYTRNMATAASNVKLAVLLLDATKGILLQTRRHSRILTLMGVRHIVLAVNKMDLAGYSQATFDKIVAEYLRFAIECGFESVLAIPMSALRGDNLVKPSAHMPWYSGPALLEYLDTTDFCRSTTEQALRMPVQWVNRPYEGARSYCGTIASGTLRPGDDILVLPSGTSARVKTVRLGVQDMSEACTGDAVTLTLAEEVDVGRGDVICGIADSPAVADMFEARMIWMGEQALLPGRSYMMKIHTCETPAFVTEIRYREDINRGARLAAKSLAKNEMAVVVLACGQPVVFEPYSRNHVLGGFILIDRFTCETVGGGTLTFALRRAANLRWQVLDVSRSARAALMRQRARCIWFTGLSGSGKSTLANLLEKRLHAEGKKTYVLDGDNVRRGLNRDLGFTDADRVENIRRIAEVARLMVDAGLIVLVAFISPFREERRMARELFDNGDFVEVFVDTPLAECERRDPKGLYARARRGELSNFTGIDSRYEVPEQPEVHVFPLIDSPEICVSTLMRALHENLPDE